MYVCKYSPYPSTHYPTVAKYASKIQYAHTHLPPSIHRLLHAQPLLPPSPYISPSPHPQSHSALYPLASIVPPTCHVYVQRHYRIRTVHPRRTVSSPVPPAPCDENLFDAPEHSGGPITLHLYVSLASRGSALRVGAVDGLV